MTFIVVAIVMTLVAAACIAVPLWRGRNKASLTASAANQAVYAARLEELERDVAAGRLAAGDFAAARRDLEHELATNLDEVQRQADRASHVRGQRVLAIIAACLLVAVPLILYWQLGNWRAGVQGVQQASVASVDQMVATLATRLHTQDPNDLQGWKMLGHAYLLMGRYADAEDAYGHALKLADGKDAEVLAGYGETVALADPKQFMTLGMPAIEQALVLAPSNPQALWYGGLGALERGDKTLAVSRWQALLAQDPPAEYRAVIEKSIAAIGGSATPRVPATSAVAAGSAEIHVRVTLAPNLRDKVSPDETLFVFAVAAGQSGGPPLLARRFEVRNLPLAMTLSGADVVVPGQSLNGFRRATVIARIARHGTPAPQSGDLEGQAAWRAGDKGPVNVLIDKVLP
ncbi:MAG: c-type cytochrome biogenesis protein CcmI [Gammaproteobacteria bacterium]|nr:c-type cytochrome biogenesis protein CcmI [Gammaproteobacteria bacterium]MBU6510410.1 c-type cytochrome biogenesis protein CcmI [Gammaproteobacteria bacterium]MDE1984635.1 c-type cytochrome biogenesis protein CcmI [Gammaproteobacteria bacterium]MDE2460543.1 c-type cytochrome biogenesis protein CcmI [Gammaproteobacteria bacterium]